MTNIKKCFILAGLHGEQDVQAGTWAVYPVYHPATALYKPEMREAMEQDWERLGEIVKSGGNTTIPRRGGNVNAFN